MIVVVLAVAVGGLYANGFLSGTSNADGESSVQPTTSITPIAPAAASSSATTMGSPEPEVEGMTRTDPPGRCYTAADIASATSLDLTVVSCAKTHDFELVAHELATGDDSTYPDPSYWSGVVAQKCYQDLLSYTGTSRDKWPTSLESDYFTPTPESWPAGNRDVYCLARSTPPATGTVKALT